MELDLEGMVTSTYPTSVDLKRDLVRDESFGFEKANGNKDGLEFSSSEVGP